jgi:hydroxymethylglutaryl-CoA reductase (NADPH)
LTAAPPPRRTGGSLVPRLVGQGYDDDQIAERRRWVEAQTGCTLEHVGATTMAGEAMRGNVENPIGAAQVPLGVAGPLAVHGEHADGVFYVPLATTEGALVRSYERGMAAIGRAGGATARLLADENKVCPVLVYEDVTAAVDAARRLPELLPELAAAAGATTRHGRLLGASPTVLGRRLIVTFSWSTGDAHGMNMIVRGSDAAAALLAERTGAVDRLAFSGMSSEKRASGSLFAGGKGKRAVAAVLLPRRVVRAVLGTTAERMVEVRHATTLGHFASGALGFNAHLANGLAALFIACGQDVANVANAAVGITDMEATAEGDLHASVHLPSLTLATVGGGTGLGPARECLEMLGCSGTGKAAKLAEIVAATLLAGEISFTAAIGSGEMVTAHEAYGRNRPEGVAPSEAAGRRDGR